MIAAARQAHADRFITEKLTHGYQSQIGQGGLRLSGGQRQRIALARAILRNPDILILDEATSQIDIESEQLIHQALEEFIAGRTAIMITHRLSTLSLPRLTTGARPLRRKAPTRRRRRHPRPPRPSLSTSDRRMRSVNP